MDHPELDLKTEAILRRWPLIAGGILLLIAMVVVVPVVQKFVSRKEFKRWEEAWSPNRGASLKMNGVSA